MNQNDDLIANVETLKNMLVACATTGNPNNNDYKVLRQELLADPKISNHLPRFVRTCRELSEFWGFIKQKFARYQERRDYLRDEFDPVLSRLESELRSPSDSSISAAVRAVNADYIQQAWHKALERRGTDPEGAITSSRTLLESVCKHILDASGLAYNDSADLPKLYSLTAKHLNLSPSQHTEEIFKQILGGCHSVIVGLGALRNRHSDAHGRGTSATKPAPRHAALAVNLAGAAATFLLETWEAKKKP